MNVRHRSSKGTQDAGLGTMFKRLGGLIDVLSDLVEKGEEIQKTGEIKGDDDKNGVRAVYGFTMRLGGGGKPTVVPFGNVKEGRQGQGPVVEETREPMVDVFDEADHVLIVAELPGVTAGDVHFEVKDDIFNLTASRGERKYQKELLLPFSAVSEGATPSFQNGVFELRLQRAK